ncbi:hypothetical protein F383_34360 [Gossypium arboreum]|uniref:Uncharacterized protein n=1 Tax=Gossypium arboreum TaxID=29729 RepID=A0A0B0PVU7_GOSAR|nr:hypothetical protein F383_34360 [Gossypium arboreum]
MTMPVLDRSYTCTYEADACPGHVLHWLSYFMYCHGPTMVFSINLLENDRTHSLCSTQFDLSLQFSSYCDIYEFVTEIMKHNITTS